MIATIGTLGVPSAGAAQTATCASQGTVTFSGAAPFVTAAVCMPVSDVMLLTASTVTTTSGLNSSSFSAASSSSASDYKAFATVHAAVTSNRNFALAVSGTFDRPKAAADVIWYTTSLPRDVTRTMAAVRTVATGTTTTSQDLTLETRWRWETDVPATYQLTVQFTLSAP